MKLKWEFSDQISEYAFLEQYLKLVNNIFVNLKENC